MTIEIAQPSAPASRVSDPSSNPELRQALDNIAAGRLRVQQMAAEFEGQRRATAQAALSQAQQLVLSTLRSSKQMLILGGDMHAMVDMVDLALRQAQPAIKTLRAALAQDSRATTDLAKAVRDLATAGQQIGFMARVAARDPAAVDRVRRSVSLLDGTLRQMRGAVAIVA